MIESHKTFQTQKLKIEVVKKAEREAILEMKIVGAFLRQKAQSVGQTEKTA